MFLFPAGLKSLKDNLLGDSDGQVLTGYLQKGSKKDNYLPQVHRPVMNVETTNKNLMPCVH